MKTKYLLLSLLFIGACAVNNDYAGDDDAFGSCPKVEINSEDKKIIQEAGGVKLFEIELVGYTGSCYYDTRVLKNKAVVSPRFKITRLTDTNVEDIHFSYYLETAEGPARFLGKKTYFAEVGMIKGVYEIMYEAPAGELSIPAGKYDVDMYVGLNAVKEDSERKVK